MQMRAGGSPGGTNIGDMLAAPDNIADIDQDFGGMRIARHNVIAVIDFQHVAVIMMIFGSNDSIGDFEVFIYSKEGKRCKKKTETKPE